MRFDTDHYFFNEIEQHGLSSSALTGYGDPDCAPEKVTFPVPERHSQVLPFTRLVMELSVPTRDVLLLVTEWGVWSSSDNRHLYQTLRQHYGDHTDLKEKPCHCFSFDEQEILLDFLYLAILAGWDFYLFSYHHSDILFVSHDEFATYFSRDRVQFIHNKVQLFFDDWKGNEIGQQLNS